MDTPAPDSVVSICGTPGSDACDEVAFQDFFLRQRGYSYSDSKKYCPASTCNIDCVEEQQLITKEIGDEKIRNAVLGDQLAGCQTLRISRYPRYCVTANGSRVAVSTQYDETSAMTCTCQSHLRLVCTVTGSSCTHGTRKYYLGEQFVDPANSCGTCTCAAGDQDNCDTGNKCPNSNPPDCSRYKNTKVIMPSDQCCPVCEAEYCKDGTVYDSSATNCTDYPTCENKNGVGCTTQARPGCVCPKNYVFDYRNVCVRSKRCPCVIRSSQQEITQVIMKGRLGVLSDGKLCECRRGGVLQCYASLSG